MNVRLVTLKMPKLFMFDFKFPFFLTSIITPASLTNFYNPLYIKGEAFLRLSLIISQLFFQGCMRRLHSLFCLRVALTSILTKSFNVKALNVSFLMIFFCKLFFHVLEQSTFFNFCQTDYRVLEQSTFHVLDTRCIDGYRKQRRRRYEGDRRSLLRL